MKILLVDDEKMIQTAISSFCKKLDIQIECASDGVEGVKLAETNTYDLILMDNYMPNMEGKEATMKIRSLTNGSTFKIIFLSGVDEPSDEELKKFGFDEFLKKPVSKKVFEEVINRYK